MLLPQMLRNLVSATESTALAFLTPRNWAEMNPLVCAMNGTLMASALVVSFEGLGAAEVAAGEVSNADMWSRHRIGLLLEDSLTCKVLAPGAEYSPRC